MACSCPAPRSSATNLIAELAVPELAVATPIATSQISSPYTPNPSGPKCRAMTTDVTMPSRYSVYMPIEENAVLRKVAERVLIPSPATP